MGKGLSKHIFPLIGLLFLSFATIGEWNEGAPMANAAVGSYSTDATTYYADISNTLTGYDLGVALRDLMISTHKTYTSYADVGNYAINTDTDPNNANNIICVYSGASVPGAWDAGNTWNREHVWCQSLSGGLWGETYAGADFHHLRPEIPNINSLRNNRPFADLGKTGTAVNYNGTPTGCYYDGNNHWEPRDGAKGDIARILMYVYVHYSNAYGSDLSYTGPLSITDIFYTAAGTESAAWDKLLDWSALDPPDDFERHQNDQAAAYQGNRNPFIDNPSYATALWGGGSITPPSSSSSSGSASSSQTSSQTSSSSSSSSSGSGSSTVILNSLSGLTDIISGSSYLISTKINATSDPYYPYLTGNALSAGGIVAKALAEATLSTRLLKFVKQTDGNYCLMDGVLYLFANNENNGLGIRSGSWEWSIAFVDGKGFTIKDTGYSRYVGLYNNQNWRCYSTFHDMDSSINCYLDLYAVASKDDMSPKTITAEDLGLADDSSSSSSAMVGSVSYAYQNALMVTSDEISGSSVSYLKGAIKLANGSIANATPLAWKIAKVLISAPSNSLSLDVYGGEAPNPSTDAASASADGLIFSFAFSEPVPYVRMVSADAAAFYSFTLELQNGLETAASLAAYINGLIPDRGDDTGFCHFNYAIAKNRLLNGGTEALSEFETSEEASIAKARQRYLRWCDQAGDGTPYAGAVLDAAAKTLPNQAAKSVQVFFLALVGLAALTAFLAFAFAKSDKNKQPVA